MQTLEQLMEAGRRELAARRAAEAEAARVEAERQRAEDLAVMRRLGLPECVLPHAALSDPYDADGRTLTVTAPGCVPVRLRVMDTGDGYEVAPGARWQVGRGVALAQTLGEAMALAQERQKALKAEAFEVRCDGADAAPPPGKTYSGDMLLTALACFVAEALERSEDAAP